MKKHWALLAGIWIFLMAFGYWVEWMVLSDCLEQGYHYNRFTGHVLCHKY